ncbi:AAA family ATPase [Proteiniclasticum sp. C24MP]|uniref:AAA family ATPase n=1 Tax=Proteiniclasticum sp. C24MP TaxID=3374101 RepID=UPI003753FDC6
MMNIQEFKECIGQNAEHIIAQGMGLERVGTKYRCPNKYSHNNGDRHPSLSFDKKALQFYCFTCTEKIDIYTYYTNYKGMSHEEVMQMEEPTDNYRIEIKEKPEFHLGDLKDFQRDYLIKRGLSDDTIRDFMIGDHQNNIGFPYLSNGEITGIKLKNMKGDKPKYLSVTGSDFGLYNKDFLNQEEPLVITEGEIDAISVYEAGYKNVVSVGTGGSSLDKLFRKEERYLQGFKALIIFSDVDEVGKAMRKAFLEKFGYLVKFPDAEEYKGCKDANEILLQHGKEQILKIIKSASVKVEGLVNINDDVELDLSKLEGNYIPTGIASVDLAINDLGPKQVSLITGRSNSGKSTVVTQIIVNAIDKGNKVFLVAGEGITSLLINNLYKNCIGANQRYYNITQVNKRYFKIPKPYVIKALKRWHSDRLSIFSKGESKLRTTSELLKLMAEEIKLNKPDLVVIDNLMSVLSVDSQNEKWNNQGDFMKALSDLAKTENVHIMLVLHPSKSARKNSSIEMEDISGASELYNLADVILAVKRIYDEDEEHDGEISVIKNRYYPDLVTAQTTYDHETGMLLELGPGGEVYKYNLSWERFIDADDLMENPEPVFQVDYEKAYEPKTYRKPKKKVKPEEAALKQIN